MDDDQVKELATDIHRIQGNAHRAGHSKGWHGFADRLHQRLMQELSIDGVTDDEWADDSRTQVFELIEEVRKEQE